MSVTEQDLQRMLAESERRNRESLERLRVGATADARYSQYEQARVTQKQLIQNLVYEYTIVAQGDPEFSKILDLVEKYAQMDVDADVDSDLYLQEGKIYQEILRKLEAYGDTLWQAQQDFVEQYGGDKSSGLSPQEIRKRDELEKLNDAKEVMRSTLEKLFLTQRDGFLEVPKNLGRRDAFFVDASKNDISSRLRLGIGTDFSDLPLFPHEPCVNDIRQGYLGDCYLISGLAAIVKNHPEKIREMIRDNHDGTATVRFFTRKKGRENQPDKFVPVYVTVNKVIATGAALGRSTNNCMWAQIIEKAYAASGMHMFHDIDKGLYAEPVPEGLDVVYKSLVESKKRNPKVKLKHEEYPWLVDKDGNLHEFEPHYSQIEGGFNGCFIEHVLGEDGIAEDLTDRYICSGTAARTFEGIEATKGKEPIYVPAILGKQLLKYTESLGLPTPTGSIFKILENWPDSGEANGLTLFSGRPPQEAIEGQRNGTISANERRVCKFALMTLREICMDYKTEFISGGKLPTDMSKPNQKILYTIADMKVKFAEKMQTLPASVRPEVMRVIENVNEAVFDPASQEVMFDMGLMLPEKYSGEYAKRHEEVFAQINEALEAKRPVSCGAPENNGVIVGGHAYTVLGTRVDHEPPHLKYVTIRNPWGTTSFLNQAITYSKDSHGKLSFSASRAEDGIFEVELSDFVKAVDNIYVNTPAHEMQQQPAEIQLQPENAHLTNSTIGRYFRALQNIETALEADDQTAFAGKGSRQYQEFKMQLSVTKTNLMQLMGRDYKALADTMRGLAQFGQAYIDYTEGKSMNSHRQFRFEMSSAVCSLAKMAQNAVENPQAQVNYDLAEHILEASNEAMIKKTGQPIQGIDDPAKKKRMVTGIMNSPEFEKGVRNKDFVLIFRGTIDSQNQARPQFQKTIMKASRDAQMEAPVQQQAAPAAQAPQAQAPQAAPQQSGTPAR